MSKLGILCIVAIIATIGAFSLTHRLQCSGKEADESAWLCKEFCLSPSQIASIQKLRNDYKPVCAEHCRKISEIRAKLTALEESGKTNTADYQSAQTEWSQLRQECAESTQRHMEQIAALMPPEQRKRYLELVAPKVTQHDHAAPLGLK